MKRAVLNWNLESRTTVVRLLDDPFVGIKAQAAFLFLDESRLTISSILQALSSGSVSPLLRETDQPAPVDDIVALCFVMLQIVLSCPSDLEDAETHSAIRREVDHALGRMAQLGAPLAGSTLGSWASDARNGAIRLRGTRRGGSYGHLSISPLR